MKIEKIAIVRIYNTSDGHSHFEDIELPFMFPVSIGQKLSKPLGLGKIYEFGENFYADWHTVKSPVYFIYLAGSQEIEVSSGEKRILVAGDFILAEDMSGIGHRSKVLSKGRAIIIDIQQLPAKNTDNSLLNTLSEN